MSQGENQKSIYNNFDLFLASAIEQSKSFSDLIEAAYNVQIFIVDLVVRILRGIGFWIFGPLLILFGLGWFGFAAGLAGFLVTPPGWVLAALFGASVTVTLYKMFRNKAFVTAVSEVGDQVKPSWQKMYDQKSSAEEFDQLHARTIAMLIYTPVKFNGEPDRWMRAYNDLTGK